MNGPLGDVVEVVGRFVSASNATLLGRTGSGDLVVYKPIVGESPLWDFPPETLAAREVLTFEVSEMLEFGVVPETIFADGPVGPGSVQRFVTPDDEFDPLAVIRAGDEALWPIALLDLVCNNADRKVGHVLREAGTMRVFAIDHGLTFHPDDKLRTVLWFFAGHPVPLPARARLEKLLGALAGSLGKSIETSLGSDELAAIRARVSGLIAAPVHPHPPDDRPPVPWPPI